MSGTYPFPIIQQNLIRCFFSSYLFFGNIGNLLNCIVFAQKSLRRSSCSIYFIALSVTNLVLLDYAVSTRFYSNEQTNPNNYAVLHCKINLYLVHTLLMITRTYIVLICFDRLCMCSTSYRIRQFSTQRIALRIVLIVPLIWFILTIHIPLFNTIQSSRCIMPGMYSFIYSIYALCVAGILPPLLMIIFTLLTYRTIKQMRARIIPASTTMQMRIKKRDHQLFGISIAQVIVYMLSTWLYPSITCYLAFIKKGDAQTLAELFLNLFGSTILVYLNSSATFYIYILMSRSFRNELKTTINKCFLHRFTPNSIGTHRQRPNGNT